MTEIIRSDGIVLRRRDLGESSRIAVVYTRARGKLQLLAKGARAPRGKFGAALEPLTRGEFVFYWREGKELLTLSEANLIASARRLRENPAALPYALAIVEAADRMTADDDPDPGVFDTITAALDALDGGGPAIVLLTHFLIKFSSQIGLLPELEKCGACGARLTGDVTFAMADSAPRCKGCAVSVSQKLIIPEAAAVLVGKLAGFDANTAATAPIPADTAVQTLAFLRKHLKYRSGLELKSLAFL